MVTDPFSSEVQPDQVFRTGGKRGRFSASQVLAGLATVGLLTLAFGFYMPLYQAQQKLKTEYQTLSSKQEATNDQLKATTEQLSTTQKEREELSQRMGAVEQARNSAAEKALDMNRQLSEALKDFIKAKKVAVSKHGDDTVITLDNDMLFRAHEVGVHPPGTKTLCAISKAITTPAGSSHIQVGGHTHGASIKNPKLRRDYPTVWEASAARAANVVTTLARCGLKSKDISAAGFADQDPNPKYPRRSTGEIRIVLSPAS